MSQVDKLFRVIIFKESFYILSIMQKKVKYLMQYIKFSCGLIIMLKLFYYCFHFLGAFTVIIGFISGLSVLRHFMTKFNPKQVYIDVKYIDNTTLATLLHMDVYLFCLPCLCAIVVVVVVVDDVLDCVECTCMINGDFNLSDWSMMRMSEWMYYI